MKKRAPKQKPTKKAPPLADRLVLVRADGVQVVLGGVVELTMTAEARDVTQYSDGGFIRTEPTGRRFITGELFWVRPSRETT